MIDVRTRKGMEIYGRGGVRRLGRACWRVNSQTRSGIGYTIKLNERTGQVGCTCLDFQETAKRCKHMIAVMISLAAEASRSGSAMPPGVGALPAEVTESAATPESRSGGNAAKDAEPKARPTYKQAWSAYNAAQTTEKVTFLRLLRALCDGVEQPPPGRGRPPLPLGDVIFAAALKVYVTISGRRATPDVRAAAEQGLLGRAPHYNSVSRYLEQPALTPVLKRLVEESATPFRGIETQFACDSSGFSTSVYHRWFDHKHGTPKKEAVWVKAHILVGTASHAIVAAEITEAEKTGSADPPHLLPLAAIAVRRGWNLAEVSADKAYLSAEILHGIAALGAEPFIPFKTNSRSDKSDIWNRAYHAFSLRSDEWLRSYHRRSNVETVFGMVKTKFGARVRSKVLTAQWNEVLLKFLCHNVCCSVQAIHELGLNPTFWGEDRPPALAAS